MPWALAPDSASSRRPLYPGDPIETLIWKTAEGQALWRTRNIKTGETVIDGGEFEYDADF